MNDAQIRELAGAEVMTWNIDALPMAVSEARGPLVVKRQGEIVRMYPWFASPVLDNGRNGGHQGDLYIRDPSKHMAVIGHHEKGTWDAVQNEPKYAGLY